MAIRSAESAERSEPKAGSGSRATAGVSSEKLLERVPPHDEMAEMSVVGAMLMDSRAADVAFEILKEDDFYHPRHRVIFTAFLALFNKHNNDQIDEVYLVSELTRQGKIDAAGGAEYIGRLILSTPSAAGIEGYCQVVRDRALERELVASAGEILQLVNQPSDLTSEQLVEQAEAMVYKIAERRTSQDATPMTDLMANVMEESEKVQAARKAGLEAECPAIATHYPDLDKLLAGGFWPGELIIIAGRPSMGKTTFALNIIRQISVGNEARVKPTAIFSLEMPSSQVAKNILCAEAKLEGLKMRRYDFNEEEAERAHFYAKVLQHAPIKIDDTAGLSLSALRARCRRLRRRHGVKLVVIDYLQLMKGSQGKQNREQEVSEISRGLKAIAREMEMPVIVLSQLNRSAEKRENDDKRPQLSDLRESGAIEQDADVVIMLYRPEYWDIEQNKNNINVGEAMVMKNRNGPVGNVKLVFRKDILRFDSYAGENEMAAGE